MIMKYWIKVMSIFFHPRLCEDDHCNEEGINKNIGIFFVLYFIFYIFAADYLIT